MAYSSVLLHMLIYIGGNKLLTTNLYNIINAIRSSSLSILVINHLWNLCRCLSQIHHGGVGGKLRHLGTHIILLHIHSKYVGSIIQVIFFRTVCIQ